MRKLTRQWVETYFCDDCGNSKTRSGFVKTCKLCGNDTCMQCRTERGNLEYRNRTEVFCESCWQIGESHREHVAKMTAILIEGVKEGEERRQKVVDFHSRVREAAKKMEGIPNPSNEMEGKAE